MWKIMADNKQVRLKNMYTNKPISPKPKVHNAPPKQEKLIFPFQKHVLLPLTRRNSKCQFLPLFVRINLVACGTKSYKTSSRKHKSDQRGTKNP